MARLVGGDQRHRRDGQDDPDGWIDDAQLAHEGPEVGGHLLDGEVVEGVVRAGLAAGHPGREREHRPVSGGDPGLGQAEGEDEYAAGLEHLAHRREVTGARRIDRLGRSESLGLDARPERIDVGAVIPQPGPVDRAEGGVGALEGLQQLAGAVDVAEPRRKHAGAFALWLGDQIVVAVLVQDPGNVLGEAAARRGDGGHRADAERRLDDGVGRLGDGAPPEGVVGKIGVWMGGHLKSRPAHTPSRRNVSTTGAIRSRTRSRGKRA